MRAAHAYVYLDQMNQSVNEVIRISVFNVGVSSKITGSGRYWYLNYNATAVLLATKFIVVRECRYVAVWSCVHV